MSATATMTAPAKSAFTMTVPPKGEGGDYELCPDGSFAATLVGLIDLGTHTDDYKGKVRTARKIALLFELSGEIKADGTPFVIAERYAASLAEKSNFRKMIKGWRGRDFEEGEEFDPAVMLGAPCMVSVIHKKVGADGKTVHNLDGVKAVPKGLPVAKPFHDLFLYALDDGPFPDPDWLPFLYGQSIKDIIAESHERQGTKPPAGNPRPAAGSNGAAAAKPVADLDDPDDPAPF